MIVYLTLAITTTTTTTTTTTNTDVIQIFFDDNIERDSAHIIDVREVKSFESVAFELSNNKYIKRVEPYDAIMNDNYYIDVVDNILSFYDS